MRYQRSYVVISIAWLIFGATIQFAVTNHPPTAPQMALISSQILNQNATGTERRVQIGSRLREPTSDMVAVTAVRNLQSENWVRDLEIEVKNTSNKPIYFLWIFLDFPDLPKSTEVDGVQRDRFLILQYGKLGGLEHRPTSQDKPIQPGESYVFRYSEGYWVGFESSLNRRNIPQSAIKVIRFRLDTVNFGDGTGLSPEQPGYLRRTPHN